MPITKYENPNTISSPILVMNIYNVCKSYFAIGVSLLINCYFSINSDFF